MGQAFGAGGDAQWEGGGGVSDLLNINFDSLGEKARLYGFLRQLKGRHQLEIKQFRPTRSNSQNALYWAVYVEALRAFLNSNGDPISAELAHQILARRLLKKTIYHPDTHQPLGEVTRSTTGLSTVEFSDYLDNVRKYLAETFHIEIPAASSPFEEVRRDN